MEIALLTDITLICGLALGVLFICHRCSIPPLLGLLFTGILAGPHGLGLVSQVTAVEHLAEIGVVSLLFTIGLEFPLKSLLEIKFMALVGGGIQVGLTIILAALLAGALGLPFNQAIFCGFLVSLSSTAIVLKILQEKMETESPHGRLIISILLFQDIIVVPMMLIVPILAGTGQDVGWALSLLLAKAIALVALTIVTAKWIIPAILYQLARPRAREPFILGIVFVALGVAWLTARLGLSLALGAFLAGLIVSESEYAHRALGNIIPFRDLFTSFFFVSIGMLFDLRFGLNNWALLLGVALLVVALKSLTAGAAASVLGMPLRTSVLTGLALAQIGEFSFVLAEPGMRLGLLEPHVYQLALGVTVVTMIATPLFIAGGDRAAVAALTLPVPERMKTGFRPVPQFGREPGLSNHLVIVGFGLNGRNLARAASTAGIPRIIVELNPDTVRKEQAAGEFIISGDASHEAVLQHAGIKQARVMVIVISDPVATRRIIDSARRLNPTLHIVARTRFVTEMEPLYELGADEVIPEDYEASIEVLVRVLNRYLIPGEDIARMVEEFRAEHYLMLRSLVQPAATFSDLHATMPDVDISSLRISDGSAAIGQSLAELGLRTRFHVTVLAIRRQSSIIPNPDGEERLMAGDICIVLGIPEMVADVSRLFGDAGPAEHG